SSGAVRQLPLQVRVWPNLVIIQRWVGVAEIGRSGRTNLVGGHATRSERVVDQNVGYASGRRFGIPLNPCAATTVFPQQAEAVVTGIGDNERANVLVGADATADIREQSRHLCAQEILRILSKRHAQSIVAVTAHHVGTWSREVQVGRGRQGA